MERSEAIEYIRGLSLAAASQLSGSAAEEAERKADLDAALLALGVSDDDGESQAQPQWESDTEALADLIRETFAWGGISSGPSDPGYVGYSRLENTTIDGQYDLKALARVILTSAGGMKRDAAKARLQEIVHGIDKAEGESSDGWWETSTGAEFGAKRLRLLEELITDLTG